MREALSQEAPEVLPVRGPDHWEKEIEGVLWTYDNTWQGDLTRFSGHEYIKMAGREIYDAEYSGGLVDQKF